HTIYTLSLHDALPILESTMSRTQLRHFTHRPIKTLLSFAWTAWVNGPRVRHGWAAAIGWRLCGKYRFHILWDSCIRLLLITQDRSEEHTSELQSRFDL